MVHINDTLVRVFNNIMPRPISSRKKKGLFGLTRERKILVELKKNGGRNMRMTSELNLELNEIRRKRRSTEQENIVRKYNKNPSDVFKFVTTLKGRGPGCPGAGCPRPGAGRIGSKKLKSFDFGNVK